MQLSPVYQFGYRSTKTEEKRAHVTCLLSKTDNQPLEAANVAGVPRNGWRSWQGLAVAEDHPLTGDSQLEGQRAHPSCT